MKRKRGPLDDIGGAKELANYRLSVAKEDLADAEYCGEIKPSNTMYRASCSDGESHHFF